MIAQKVPNPAPLCPEILAEALLLLLPNECSKLYSHCMKEFYIERKHMPGNMTECVLEMGLDTRVVAMLTNRAQLFKANDVVS